MVRFIGQLIFAIACFSLLTGFDTGNAIVPEDEILSGGPPKDGIPALLNPKFVAAGKAGFLDDDDPVIGVAIGNTARAYPIRILNWHEAVNDSLSGEPFVVTF